MKWFVLKPLLGVLVPIITGFIVPPLWTAIKNAQSRLAGLSPAVQRGVVLVLSGAISTLAVILGVELPTDFSQWTEVTVQAVVGAALAFGIHAGDKTKELSAKLKTLELQARVVPSVDEFVGPVDR